MIQAVASQHGRKMSHEDVLQMSLHERSDYLQNNPMPGVHMFQHRVENFSQYLLSSSMPLGEISDHVIKIEFQMRGTHHAHCLLWIEGAPKIDTSSDNAVCEFIGKYITADTTSNLGGFSHKCSSYMPSDTCTFGLLSKKMFLSVWIPKAAIIKNYYCSTPS